MSRKIELLSGYFSPRGNFYPAGIYEEAALPKQVLKLDEYQMRIIESKKGSQKQQQKSKIEEKDVKEVAPKTREVKSTRKKIQKKEEPKEVKTKEINTRPESTVKVTKENVL